MTAQEWLDRQPRVSDGDADDGVEAADFDRDEDPDLFDAIEEYLDLRDQFENKAHWLVRLMIDRGWGPR